MSAAARTRPDHRPLWPVDAVVEQETDRAHVRGTHRALPPEKTWELVRPVAEHAGVTRVADVTWLDCIGIPTFQAVRPRARSLSVSQGKGVTPMLAKVSAVMESVELWHAEHLEPPAVLRAPIREVAPSLGYDPFRLCMTSPTVLTDDMPLAWLPARRLGSDGTTFVPRDFVDMDGTLRAQWCPPTFAGSSNGLSSGNTRTEATLHGLYEVIERESIAAALERPRASWAYLDPDSLPPVARGLVERFRAAGVSLVVSDVTGATGIPVYHAYGWSDGFPLRMSGAGCHLDPDVALCRALTEAAQARITQIAGSRDDLKNRSWRLLRDSVFEAHALPERTSAFDPTRHPGPGEGTLADDLDRITGLVRGVAGVAPLVVDLTKPDVGLPVVKVVVPGFRYGEVEV
jgi:ribosomal protein S12 methylthiotransferase accessory factor